MNAPLRSLMFVGQRVELEPEPTSGLRTVDRKKLESATTDPRPALSPPPPSPSPVAESVVPPPSTPGPARPGLYAVRLASGARIWVHVTPD